MILPLLLAALIQNGPQDGRREDSSDAAAAAVAASQGRREFACVRDGTTPELNACASEDLGREQERMERYLQAASLRALERDADSSQFTEPTHQSAWLDASQPAWEAYASIRCGGVYDSWKSGTIRTIMSIDCMIDATRQRTHDIWRDHLTYMDSTPPVLPEPLRPVTEEDPSR